LKHRIKRHQYLVQRREEIGRLLRLQQVVIRSKRWSRELIAWVL